MNCLLFVFIWTISIKFLFHVCNDDRSFNACICIEMAYYLPHGDINDVLDTE